MRALQSAHSCVSVESVLQFHRSLHRRSCRLQMVYAAQQVDSSSSNPGGLRDLYRGLVAAPTQSRKASSGSKPAKSGAGASSKQKSANSAAASKRTISKSKPTAGSPQEQRTEQDSAAARAKADRSSRGSKPQKAASKADKLTAAPQPRVPLGSLLPSNGRGFGSVQSSSKSIKKNNHLASAASSSSSSSKDTSTNSPEKGTSRTGSSNVLKVFRFGVDAAAVQKAVDSCGWRDRVLQVDVLAQADMLIAVKDTAGGKHQNLKQGERAAHNAGIPFVIVGRRMTKFSLRAALSRYLNPITPEQAAAQEAQQAKEAEAKAAADAWFSAATTARFSGTRLPTKNMQQLQQQQQQRLSVGQ